MLYRVLFGLTFLAVIAAAFFIGQSGSVSQRTAAHAEPREPDPGYAARDAEIIETGADGRERYRLIAALIHQRPTEDSVQLESIRMEYRTEAQDLWKVSAQSGQVLQSGDRIELNGKVRVVGPLPESRGQVELATERLRFDTRAERVESDAPVVFTWEGQQLRAHGITANLKDGRVQLKSKVDGRFIP